MEKNWVQKLGLSVAVLALLTAPVMALDGALGGRNITGFDRIGQRQVGGYFDTEWKISNPDNGSNTNTFTAHRFILEAASQVHERILVSSEIEFEYGGKLEAGDDDTEGEIKIEQAWVDYQLTDAVTFRSGIVLVPFGRLNIYHDSDYRDATNRPLFASYIVPTTWSDTGFGIHGEVTSSNDWEWQYEAYVINGLRTGASDSKGLKGARPTFKTDNNTAKSYVAHLGVSPKLGLQLGTSVYTGAYDGDGDKNLGMLGFDGYYKTGPFEILGEWAMATIENNDPDSMNGFYVEGRYHFFPSAFKNLFFANGFEHPTFTLFARYSEVDLNTDATTSTGDLTAITAGINYRPIESFVIKMEYERTGNKENNDVTNSLISSIAVGF